MCKVTSTELFQASTKKSGGQTRLRAQTMTHSSSSKAGTPLVQFPAKLYDMVSAAEEQGFEHIVSWLGDGRGFQIHDPEALTEILSKFFKQTKYKSFLRQLQNYGFARVIKGPNKGICRHRFFVKGQRSLTQQVKRVSRSGSPSEQDTTPSKKTSTMTAMTTTTRSPVKSTRKPSRPAAAAIKKQIMTPTMSVSNMFDSASVVSIEAEAYHSDPEICALPPCEVKFLDTVIPSSSASSAEAAIPFHGQRFFVV